MRCVSLISFCENFVCPEIPLFNSAILTTGKPSSASQKSLLLNAAPFTTLRSLVKRLQTPAFGYLSEFGVLEGGGEKFENLWVVRGRNRRAGRHLAGERQSGVHMNGVEIDEPTLEDRPRKRLQRRIHPTVQLDLVVQRSKDRRDRSLLDFDGRNNTGIAILRSHG